MDHIGLLEVVVYSMVHSISREDAGSSSVRTADLGVCSAVSMDLGIYRWVLGSVGIARGRDSYGSVLHKMVNGLE